MTVKKKNPKPAGRHSPYKSEYCLVVKKLCRLGAKDKEIADFFEVTETTINNWKIEHPDFFESMKKGKEISDAEIANSLYHRAKGYEHPDEEIKVVSVGNNGGSEIIRVPVIKHYPPDTAAAFIWLKNRRPSDWREKVIHGYEGDLPPQKIEIVNPYDMAKDKNASDDKPKSGDAPRK